MTSLPSFSVRSLLTPMIGAAGIALGLGTGATLAHDGHSGAPVSIVVTRALVSDTGLNMTLSIANRSHIPVQIDALQSDLGPVAGLELPYFVLAGQTDVVHATLIPRDGDAAGLPSIFTLMVDMADLGSGPVLVMPDV